jgi:diaminopimelate epimerase
LIFWKYHGLGNDFLVVEDFDGKAPKDADFVKRSCERRFGVGADGILYVGKGEGVDATMRVLNSDGSEAEMCGNGIRCVAKHLRDFGFVKKSKMTIGTLAGEIEVDCFLADGQVKEVAVNMGTPSLECDRIPMSCMGRFVDKEIEVDDKHIKGTAVSMGNPHFVIFDRLREEDKELLGPRIERHPLFPKRTNVEFASIHGNRIEVRVFERGAGWTMACGTGACAVAVAAVVGQKVPPGREVEIVLPGGSLWIKVAENLSSVTMRGPAARVFKGELEE